MLGFQILRVYQRSIELLALTMDVIAALPKGNVDLLDQLLRAAESQPRNSPRALVARPDNVHVERSVDVQVHVDVDVKVNDD